MARLPKSPAEAVALLGVKEGGTAVLAGPANGFVEAFAEAVGASGSVVVQDPPPDAEGGKTVSVVDGLTEDHAGDPVVVWIGPVAAHEVRHYAKRVADDGTLWIVVPRAEREGRAPVTEGDIKRSLLVAGWREDRNVPISTDSYALRFRRR